jgi:hypothetical protein
MRTTLLLVIGAAIVGIAPQLAQPQYPNISKEIGERSDAKKKAADDRSDAVFEKSSRRSRRTPRTASPTSPAPPSPKISRKRRSPAFPGAWGGGMYSHGGRGGRVIVVTSWPTPAPARSAKRAKPAGPRVVVFNVAGIIKLDDRIPHPRALHHHRRQHRAGRRVCIAGNTVELESHDIIVRHMRFRRGATDVGDSQRLLRREPRRQHHDRPRLSLVGAGREHVHVPPHVSPARWREGREASTVNITIQNSIFSEGLKHV